jgi:hypothetical protein
MTDNTCNGWTNASTWTVNLHFGDYWGQLVEEGEQIDGDSMRSDVEACVDEILDQFKDRGGACFIRDMMGLGEVNWWELSRHYEKEDA